MSYTDPVMGITYTDKQVQAAQVLATEPEWYEWSAAYFSEKMWPDAIGHRHRINGAYALVGSAMPMSGGRLLRNLARVGFVHIEERKGGARFILSTKGRRIARESLGAN